jgi:hypothetical protein
VQYDQSIAMLQPTSKATREEPLKMRERVIVAIFLAMLIAIGRESWRLISG